jgi:hypothetical protein
LLGILYAILNLLFPSLGQRGARVPRLLFCVRGVPVEPGIHRAEIKVKKKKKSGHKLKVKFRVK